MLRRHFKTQSIFARKEGQVKSSTAVKVGKQLGFSDYEQTTAKKNVKKEKFLTEMNKVVPWRPPPRLY